MSQLILHGLRVVWQPQLYSLILIGYLLGRALPQIPVAPLGIAFFAAVRGVGISSTRSLFVGAAILGGGYLVREPKELAGIAVAISTCHLLATLLRMGKRQPSPFEAAAMAAAASAVPLIMLGSGTPLELVFWVGLIGVMALLFGRGVLDITSGRLLHPEYNQQPIFVVVLMVAAFSGLEQVVVGDWLVPANTVAAFIVLLSAHLGGLSLAGAAVAALAFSFLFSGVGVEGETHGLTAVLPGLPVEWRTVAFLVAGSLAGLFRDLQKFGVSVAFITGLLVATVFGIGGDRSTLIPFVSSAAVAVPLFWLFPSRWLTSLTVLISNPNLDASTEQLVSSTPIGLIDRIRGVARVLREVSSSFEQVAAVKSKETESLSVESEVVANTVCQSCSMFQQCWHLDSERTIEVIAGLGHQIDLEGPLALHAPPAQLEQFCIRSTEVVAALNYSHALRRIDQRWVRRLDDARALAGDYAKNVARLLDSAADNAEYAEGDWLASTPVLRVEVGLAKLPKRGNHLSGDSHIDVSLGSDRYLMALSDGMGVGRTAAKESRNTVSLLHQIIAAGLSAEIAINTINSVLLVRSETETFSTVDLAILDLGTGRAELVKIGAAPSFIKRGTNVTVIKSATVPLGIIDQIQIEPESRTMRPGDFLVMVTDGIWDVAKAEEDKERWIISHLQRESSSDPEEMAEGLLARALEISPDAGDDMTVLIARIDPISELRDLAESRVPFSGDWIAARHAPRLKPDTHSR